MGMRSTRMRSKIVAVGGSFWIAVAACVLGCMQPMFAKPAGADRAHGAGDAVRQSGADNLTQDLTSEMDCCYHEHPAVPDDGNKPSQHRAPHGSPHDAVSCCPLDATITPTAKFKPPELIEFRADAIGSYEFHFAFATFSDGAAFAPAFWHSGRDTLRKTHVLRI